MIELELAPLFKELESPPLISVLMAFIFSLMIFYFWFSSHEKLKEGGNKFRKK